MATASTDADDTISLCFRQVIIVQTETIWSMISVENIVKIIKRNQLIKHPYMANLDLTTIWNTVKTATSAANGGSLSQSSLTDIAKSVITSAISSLIQVVIFQFGSIDYIGIAKQLLSLYNQFKGSSNSTEKAAATNVKSVSDIIAAMGGDKDSIISAGASVLGNILGGNSSDKSNGSDLGSTIGGVLGGIFGKK